MTRWTVDHQAPLSMGLSRQGYRSGLPFPSPEHYADAGMEPASFTSPALDWCHLGSPHCYSVEFSSVQSCPTLCSPMDCSTPDFFVLHHLPELAQTHAHLVSDAIQPSHPLSPLLLLPSVFPSICHHPYMTTGKTPALTRRPLLASLSPSSNSIPLHP